MWSAPTSCTRGRCRLQGHHSEEVNSDPSWRVHRRIRWAVGPFEGTLSGTHTSPNVDVLPLTRKELREYILVSSLGYPLPLLIFLYLYLVYLHVCLLVT